MLAHERQSAIRQILDERGTIQVSELARDWGVSEMTIRRDLKALQDKGLVARVHGGAVAGGALRFKARMSQHQKAKAAAAHKLIDRLPAEGAIYLDGSTTIYHLAEALAKRGGLLVATNNVDTFQRLASYPGIEALLLGGALNRDTDNLVGPMARRMLGTLSFDAAFCSAFALHPEHGCCEPAPEDAEIKQLVCERAERIHLAIDHYKIGERAAACWRPDPEHTTIATDLDPDDYRIPDLSALASTIL